MPSFDGGDNFVGALGPVEGSWIGVGFGEEAPEEIERGKLLGDGVRRVIAQRKLGPVTSEDVFDHRATRRTRERGCALRIVAAISVGATRV